MPCPTHHIPGPKPYPTSDYILGVWGHGPGHSDPNLKAEATNHLTSGHGSFLGYTHRPTGALLAILSLAPLVLTVDASDTLASPLMTLYDFHIFIIKVTNKTMHSSPSHYHMDKIVTHAGHGSGLCLQQSTLHNFQSGTRLLMAQSPGSLPCSWGHPWGLARSPRS